MAWKSGSKDLPDRTDLLKPLESEDLHRTVKLEMDEGRAHSFEEAYELARRYVLQIHVAPNVVGSATREAMLLTAINCGMRAFAGGVRVQVSDSRDRRLISRWAHNRRLSDAITEAGGHLVRNLTSDAPTIVVGENKERALGTIVLVPTWHGWSGAVHEENEGRLPETLEFPLAGILAGALAVSEAFQHVRGSVVAGRRNIGLSLWRPDADWRTTTAVGPNTYSLPTAIWIAGLGHLGQAYCWALGVLPYPPDGLPELLLQDVDVVSKANEATSLLATLADVGTPKTRVLASRLEGIGFRTRVVERRVDEYTNWTPGEPRWAFGGFDDAEARRALVRAGFAKVIDAGIGAGPTGFLQILVNSFPSGQTADDAWPRLLGGPTRFTAVHQPAYQDLANRAESSGLTSEEATCGIVELAGRSVGASFVGAAAACLVLGEALRTLTGGQSYEVIDFSLQHPHLRETVPNRDPGEPTHPGFVSVAA